MLARAGGVEQHGGVAQIAADGGTWAGDRPGEAAVGERVLRGNGRRELWGIVWWCLVWDDAQDAKQGRGKRLGGDWWNWADAAEQGARRSAHVTLRSLSHYAPLHHYIRRDSV